MSQRADGRQTSTATRMREAEKRVLVIDATLRAAREAMRMACGGTRVWVIPARGAGRTAGARTPRSIGWTRD